VRPLARTVCFFVLCKSLAHRHAQPFAHRLPQGGTTTTLGVRATRQLWRRWRELQQPSECRAKDPRIDYWPSHEALALPVAHWRAGSRTGASAFQWGGLW